MLTSNELKLLNLNPEGIISPRTGASLVSISSSKLILFGGASPEEGFLNSTFVIDVNNLICQHIPTSSTIIPSPRYDHFAGLCSHGMVVFGGGAQTQCLSDTWLLNIETKEWKLISTTGDTPSPRTARGAATIFNDCLYVCGGGEQGSSPVRDMSLYMLDFITCHWTKWDVKGPEPRLGHTFHGIKSNPATFILFGGMSEQRFLTDAWSFNLAQLKWHLLPFTSPALSGHTTAFIKNTFWLTGGLKEGFTISNKVIHFPLPSLKKDEPSSFKKEKTTWEEKADFLPRVDHSLASVMHTNHMIAFGGMDHEGIYNDFYLIDTDKISNLLG